jgi:hypothetical protein
VSKNRILVEAKKRTFKQCCGTGFTDSGYELIESGSGSRFSSESGSRLLMTKKWKKQLKKIYLFSKIGIYLSHVSFKTSRLKEKPSVLKREHPPLQKMKFINFFLFL